MQVFYIHFYTHFYIMIVVLQLAIFSMAMPNTRDLPHPTLKKMLYLVTGGLILTSVTGSHPQKSILHPFLLYDCCSPNGHLEPFGAIWSHLEPFSTRRSCGNTRFIRSYGSYKEVMRLHMNVNRNYGGYKEVVRL